LREALHSGSARTAPEARALSGWRDVAGLQAIGFGLGTNLTREALPIGPRLPPQWLTPERRIACGNRTFLKTIEIGLWPKELRSQR